MSLPDPGAPGGPVPEPPVCPRHPDRVAYVRCQRCGRPVCPECQRPAAVGVHCVDCVREAVRVAPERRTVFGAVVRDGPPLVTLTVLGVTLASFLVQLVVGDAWTEVLWFWPAGGEVEPYRFLSAALAHATGGSFGLTHILFNMVALWMIGPALERVLGRWRFLALYVLAVAGGNVMVLLLAEPFTREWVTAHLGASGGIFGLFGALVVIQRRFGGDMSGVLVILGLNLVLGFVVPGISWEGHVGGLITGLAVGAVYAYAPRRRRAVFHVAGVLVVAALLVVLAVGTYAAV
ncbi:MAG: rhomboid family intramembrane serine protease [Actinomycetales bacterium]|nr:rhomboid family intramembrane serine protease [Actinomycetales bacterium]